MKRFFKDDIEYRISNLEAEIANIRQKLLVSRGDFENGYREGRLASMESELRFLEDLIKEDSHG